MTACHLEAPGHAFAGEPVKLTCRIDGAPPMTEVRVQLQARAGGSARTLGAVEIFASSGGSGYGTTRLVIGEQAGPVAVIATPTVDGQTGTADTAVVVLR